MSKKNGIDVGDYVRVYFGDAPTPAVEGVVEYMPCQPGDYWIIAEDDGDVVYVQNCAFIRRRLTDNE